MRQILVSGLVNTETTVQIRQFPIPYYPIDYPFFGVDTAVSGVAYNIVRALHTLGDGVRLLSMTGSDVPAALLLDVELLVLFGTALSSCVNFPLSTNGQASAVGTIVSAGYGFICDAYMPISQFSEGLQKVISFLPGTYGTSLLRNHALRGVFEEMGAQGFPREVVEAIKDSVDCNLYFFGSKVEFPTTDTWRSTSVFR